MNKERAIYDSKFKAVLGELFSTARGAKTSDYGETWKRLGLQGIYVKLFIKEGRLNNLVWGNKTPELKDESVRDTLLDMACYAIYGVICLDEQNMTGKESKDEHEKEMLRILKEKFEGIKEEVKTKEYSFDAERYVQWRVDNDYEAKVPDWVMLCHGKKAIPRGKGNTMICTTGNGESFVVTKEWCKEV